MADINKQIVKGLPELIQNLAVFKAETFEIIKKAVGDGVIMIQNEAKLDHGADAHTKSRYKDVTTNLTQSIQAQVPEDDGRKITAEVIAGMEYAANVELGTPKSRPYPYLFPAMEKVKDKIISNLTELVKKIQWLKG